MKTIVYVAIAALALSSCQESLEERCAREAKDYTEKKCPAKIGENTIIDSLTFDRATHTMHYYYTLTGAADNPEVVMNTDPSGLLIQQLKNSTIMKAYKDAGYNFAYTYHSQKKKGLVLFEKTLTPKDYK